MPAVWRRLATRARAADQHRVDALIALVVLMEMQLELALLIPSGTPDRALGVFAACCSAAGAGLRRRRPIAGVALVMTGFTIYDAMPVVYGNHLVAAFFLIFVGIYSVGRHTDSRRFVAGALVALGGAVVAQVLQTAPQSLDGDAVTTVVFVGGPLLVGRVLRSRARLHAALREKAADLERTRADEAAAAAVRERTRIAGELHDVVAHALSAMTVQASAARRLAGADPDRAAAAFATVEGTGREALAEIRRLLGVLRKEDEEIALAPQPSLRHVGTLARRAGAAGLPVTVTIEGDEAELPAGVDLTAYRVVQEALTGALDDGGAGRAAVLVRYRPDALDVEVVDDGAHAATRPLLGVRERVAVHGGKLTAAPRSAGGHAVRVRLPLGGAG